LKPHTRICAEDSPGLAAVLHLHISEPFDFGRKVSGVISWSINGTHFPDALWSDFPVILLSWWVAEASKLRSGAVDETEFSFMDGPFTVLVSKRGGAWGLQFVREGVAGNVTTMATCEVSPDEVIKELAAGGESLVRLCKERGWVTNDLETLERELRQLNVPIM
jgi:hypothetical protein